jgi:hypothetical protein
MKSGKFWLAVLAAGVVANIIDALIMGGLMAPSFAGVEGMRNDEGNIPWFIVGDFVAVFVMALVYDRVYGSFSGGAKGGATYGFYAGLLVSFPTWIFMHLMIKGFPYGLAWTVTIYGILWGVLVGAILGAIHKKGTAA